MSNNCGTWVSVISAVIGGATLWVAWNQLTEANSSLRAANTLALAREARDVADRIVEAGADKTKISSAYDRYGDHLAYAGYLHLRGQIDEDVWLDINDNFCRLFKTYENFDLWYQRNISTEHLIKLFPPFGDLGDKCK